MNVNQKKRFFSAALILILALILAERAYILHLEGPMFSLESDDVDYIKSGIQFAKTGMITMHNSYPTAMILPGMPVILGLLSRIFGEGVELWTAAKVLWIICGTIEAFFIYKAVCELAPKWCGLIVMLAFLAPNLAWRDNLIMTETPFGLFFAMCLYFTFAMANRPEKKHFIGYVCSFMAAYMFRANIISLPLFTFIYLAIKKKYSFRQLSVRIGLLLAAFMLFTVPWTVRNHRLFDAFIPVSYGSGNPLLLGTYQGDGFPEEEEPDYYAIYGRSFQEEYAGYLDDDGNPLPEYEQYVYLLNDGAIAKHRMKTWYSQDPVSFIKSYFVIKPLWMVNWVWYWNEYFGVSVGTLQLFRKAGMIFCVLTIALAFIKKQKREEAMLLAVLYAFNILILASAFACDRYAEMNMPLRYLLSGIGLALVAEIITRTLHLPEKALTGR